ncbi:CDP-glucose 4,6-dehydratase [Paraburkholderia nemoris]|uniref:CDP-glucose 4,6-dehydratase n=1 Tax=Paraburkholderia TaxID=1822464 RepID=UPI00190CF26D|nr:MULTISPECIES: CDP-glucose 4,6-dehydratase [Paraburkholderia]MBK3784866.1 CDP-glucose 4,6-dehydratase [Paraburkholderia aspalathi]CAE6795222.1 CDP-glucose 4,6-dehydratase [Paraburkholderia aspalathi]CAE6828846.1 CDP-glucose 4,6-dehydratase [Paraburkholderia nemoris]
MMDGSFWQGKRIFLTGHTGFKGSWTTLWLHALGAKVTGYSLAPETSPNLFSLARVSDGVDSVIGDIRNREQLLNAVKAAKPEIVIHMAAQPLVRESYVNPVETYETNVLGTVHLLDAIRQVPGVRSVVIVTTDKCYENREWEWGYRENEAMGGYDPYSSSKGCAELVTAAYRNSFFNPATYSEHGVAVASARAGNVIGGGDWAADRLIPDIIRAITNGETVNIRNPHAIRPWQHVLEPLSGYLVLAEKLFTEGTRYAEAWNFGPNDSDAQPVQAIVERLTSQWGDNARWALDGGDHPHEATFLKLECSKAHTRLGWRPRWDLGHTLDNIVAWYKAAGRHEDMRAVTLAQINEYTQS